MVDEGTAPRYGERTRRCVVRCVSCLCSRSLGVLALQFRQLEEQLKDEFGADVEVVSTGSGGAGCGDHK